MNVLSLYGCKLAMGGIRLNDAVPDPADDRIRLLSFLRALARVIDREAFVITADRCPSAAAAGMMVGFEKSGANTHESACWRWMEATWIITTVRGSVQN
jgi:hypothetical protein